MNLRKEIYSRRIIKGWTVYVGFVFKVNVNDSRVKYNTCNMICDCQAKFSFLDDRMWVVISSD